jgi:transposase
MVRTSKKNRNQATANKSKAHRRTAGYVHGYFRRSTSKAMRIDKPDKHERMTKKEIKQAGGTKKQLEKKAKNEQAKAQINANKKRRGNP